MSGERWPDKRARAVIFAGARRHADEGGPDPDAVADLALQVRENLFVDDEVREDTADPQAHRIGYSRDCMQFATLEPSGDGLVLSLWLDGSTRERAMKELNARTHSNPFRNLYGWVEVPLTTAGERTTATWAGLGRAAAAHAAAEKARRSATGKQMA